MRVLYVEDTAFLAEAVKHNLERQGSLLTSRIMVRMA